MPKQVYNVIGKSITHLFSDYLCSYSASQPTCKALVVGERSYTYQQLAGEVALCAKALINAGVKQGEKVAILCTTRAEYWITFLATTSIGAIWLGVNPKYKLPEIRTSSKTPNPNCYSPWPASNSMTIHHLLPRYSATMTLSNTWFPSHRHYPTPNPLLTL